MIKCDICGKDLELKNQSKGVPIICYECLDKIRQVYSPYKEISDIERKVKKLEDSVSILSIWILAQFLKNTNYPVIPSCGLFQQNYPCGCYTSISNQHNTEG